MKVVLWEIKDQTTTVYLSKYPESSNSHHCSYTIQIYFLGRYLPHFGFIILRYLLTFCLFNSQYINNHKFIKILVNCPSKLITFWQLLCSNLSNSTKEKFSTRIYLKKKLWLPEFENSLSPQFYNSLCPQFLDTQKTVTPNWSDVFQAKAHRKYVSSGRTLFPNCLVITIVNSVSVITHLVYKTCSVATLCVHFT